MNSAIYRGRVRHRRFLPHEHQFSYPLAMFAVDLDEVDQIAGVSRLLSRQKWAALSFYRPDYMPGSEGDLKAAVIDKVAKLGGNAKPRIDRVVALCQLRCFGLYFSPINMYFCYDQQGQASLMLAEVSNTPWNQRHYYLVDLKNPQPSDKDFHVSPFMSLDMAYHWKIQPPDQRLKVHIENRREVTLFDATLAMRRLDLNSANVRKTLMNHPNMVLSLLKGIYWQALRLLLKRTPLHLHPERSQRGSDAELPRA